jgi:aspartyl-tRNA(Asn)/glutamyl-tRNA(Gln) amidotransferase subunit C
MLDPEIVEHVSVLARLSLSDDDKQKMREELSQILENFDALSELDTSAIPPTAQVIPLENTMREDVVRACLPKEDVLANAPRTHGDFIRVPAVLKEF